jgi:hypothetical protein
MGRKRRERNYTSQRNNSTEGLVGNEQNGHPVPDPQKTVINFSNDPSDAHKKILQRGNHGRAH